jgi:hypothetical protein
MDGLRWKRFVFALAPSVALLGLQLYMPTPTLANSFPGWANSHYMSPVSTSYMHARGCDLGHDLYQDGTVTDLAVILDFGAPAYSSGYGARLWSGTSGQFESTSWIASRVEQFEGGFYACSPVDETLTVLVGVNSDSSTVGSGHGTAWANMVDSINSWLTSSGFDWQIWTMGAIDIEAGFYATMTSINAWVDAYSGAADSSFVYDFGSLNGCPTDASYAAPPGKACNRWRQQSYYYVAWGCALCTNIGEIYNTTLKTLPDNSTSDANAQQWEGIRRYAYHEKSDWMLISGSTTQYTSCHDQGHSCSGTNNTPIKGWTHLHNSIGAYTPVDTYLAWSTDFMWGW